MVDLVQGNEVKSGSPPSSISIHDPVSSSAYWRWKGGGGGAEGEAWKFEKLASKVGIQISLKKVWVQLTGCGSSVLRCPGYSEDISGTDSGGK